MDRCREQSHGPKVGFDDDGNLVFKKGMYETYHRFLDICKDISYPQETVTALRLLCNLTTIQKK